MQKEHVGVEKVLVFRRGGRVWLNALVLKTSVRQRTGGSNPSLSAKIKRLDMPIYRFSCLDCEEEFELFMTMRKRYEEKDEPSFECSKCKSLNTKPVLHKSSFSLKGKGWYRDNYS